MAHAMRAGRERRFARMTESEWLAGDLAAQLRFAQSRLSPRRQRLLAVAMCRAAAPEHADVRAALDVIENCADGTAPPGEVERARQRCREIAQQAYEVYRHALETGGSTSTPAIVEVAWATSFAANTPVPLTSIAERLGLPVYLLPLGDDGAAEPDTVWSDLAAPLRALVLEVAGNPFREVPFDPDWRTDTARALARQMYDRREFSAMPVLADALQDAGCDNDDVLNHCRDPRQVHVRGCWVLDAVLGL
jgi:hypothetical protein